MEKLRPNKARPSRPHLVQVAIVVSILWLVVAFGRTSTLSHSHVLCTQSSPLLGLQSALHAAQTDVLDRSMQLDLDKALSSLSSPALAMVITLHQFATCSRDFPVHVKGQQQAK